MGDVVFTTPAVRALRRRYPEARLDYLVEDGAAPIVRHSPHLDTVIEVARPRGLARVFYDIVLARRLRRAGYDVAIDFHGGPRSAWLVRATGARQRIGYDIPGRRAFYTTRVPWHPSLVPPRHSVLNQWDLLTPLGIGPPDPAVDGVEMTPGADARSSAAARLTAAGVPPDAPLVVLHVSASNPFRRWPRESFARVAAALAREDRRRRIMITAGPSEADAALAVADEAAREAGDAAGAIVRCGEPSLEELHVIMTRAQLFIGGDSGPLHVAATTAVPIVALFGPTLAERSMPWRPHPERAAAVEPGPLACRPCHQRVCVHGDFRCLTALSPEAVLAAARRVLENDVVTAIALSAARSTALERIDRVGWWALAAAVAALQISIAAAQIAVTVAALAWLARTALGGVPDVPRFAWPLAIYAGLTLLSAALSRDPAVSVPDTKQLVLFLLVPVVFEFGRGARARTLATVAISVGAASALVGIVQYGVLNYDNLGRRPQGTLSHWMTYSGTLMLVICATVARLAFDARDRVWASLVMPALVAGLGLTFTRSAWVGVSAGVGTLFLLKDRRLIGLLPIAVAVLVAAAPGAVTSRVYSMFDRNDPTNRDRMAMLEAGEAIVRDHPLTGVGPDMISRVYPRYRVPWAVQPNNPHLHNVPMQIAAERGLPALAVWAWFVVSVTRGTWRRLRRTRYPALAAGGLAVVAAMLTAGLFEYNFGDSEFLMLFLVLVTLPFAADRDGGLP